MTIDYELEREMSKYPEVDWSDTIRKLLRDCIKRKEISEIYTGAVERAMLQEKQDAITRCELDAVNLYEQMAALAENKHVKMVLLDIAKEEKTHVGEFQALLLMTDKQQEKELVEGKKEIEELTN